MAQYYTRYPRTTLWLIQGGRMPYLDGARAGDGIEVPSFYLSKFPITNVQYEAFDGEFARSDLCPGDDDPAAGVSFVQAQAYASWYAEVSRKPMRLPTETEWEFACRGQSTEVRYWDEGRADEFVWHRLNSESALGPLAAKKANPAGLFGMLGGVWEWTVRGAADPRGILCGGSFRDAVESMSCQVRRTPNAPSELAEAGFRLAKSLR